MHTHADIQTENLVYLTFRPICYYAARLQAYCPLQLEILVRLTVGERDDRSRGALLHTDRRRPEST